MFYPLWSKSNILKATEKLDSGMLSKVNKNMYLKSKTMPNKFKIIYITTFAFIKVRYKYATLLTKNYVELVVWLPF